MPRNFLSWLRILQLGENKQHSTENLKNRKSVTFSSEYQTELTTHRSLPSDTMAPCPVPEAPPCYWKHRKAPSCPHSCLIPLGPHEVTNRRVGGISRLKLSLSDLKNNEFGKKPNGKGRPKRE